MTDYQKRLIEEEERSRDPYGWMNDEMKTSDIQRDNVLKTAGKWIGSKINELWNGLTGKTSAQATLEANKMNIENQNYWNRIAMQREDTAYQRQMADLQAAGLNPWLTTGSGAQTAALSTAQAEPVDGSKMLQATSAAALLAVVKLLSRTTSKSTTNVNYNYKR